MEFMDVVQSVDAEIERVRDSQSFYALAEKPFADVISLKLHVQALNKLLCAVRDEHLPITARHTSGRYIILHSSPLSSWALIFHDVPSQYLYLSPVYVLQANVGEPSSLSVERYCCSAPRDFGHLEDSVELGVGTSEDASPGVVLKRNGTTDILDWRRADSQSRPGVTLRINSYALAPFEWAFDRKTRRPVGLSPIHSIESNLTTLLSLLAVCGNERTVEITQELLTHERHFLRWAAAKTIASLDGSAGVQAALRLADDAHPEVRAAARAALSAHPSKAGKAA